MKEYLKSWSKVPCWITVPYRPFTIVPRKYTDAHAKESLSYLKARTVKHHTRIT